MNRKSLFFTSGSSEDAFERQFKGRRWLSVGVALLLTFASTCACQKHGDGAGDQNAAGVESSSSSEVAASDSAAPQVESSTAEAGSRRTFTVGDVEFGMRYCPPGYFTRMSGLGMTRADSFDFKFSNVTLTQGFWILETECSEGLWKSVTSSYPRKPRSPDRVFYHLDYDDCGYFLQKLNSLGVAPEGYEFRLPTEAEWEYASRSGAKVPLPPRSSASKGVVDVKEDLTVETYLALTEALDSSTVTSSTPNRWGIYGMFDGVGEWCSDVYGEYPKGDVTDPTGARFGKEHVVRDDLSDYPNATFHRVKRRGETSGFLVGLRFVLAPIRAEVAQDESSDEVDVETSETMAQLLEELSEMSARDDAVNKEGFQSGPDANLLKELLLQSLRDLSKLHALTEGRDADELAVEELEAENDLYLSRLEMLETLAASGKITAERFEELASDETIVGPKLASSPLLRELRAMEQEDFQESEAVGAEGSEELAFDEKEGLDEEDFADERVELSPELYQLRLRILKDLLASGEITAEKFDELTSNESIVGAALASDPELRAKTLEGFDELAFDEEDDFAFDEDEEDDEFDDFEFDEDDFADDEFTADDLEAPDTTPAGALRELTLAGEKYNFRYCPAGFFTMGAIFDEYGAEKEVKETRPVLLTRGFWILESETPQRLWTAVMGSNPSEDLGDDLPVETVSFDDCVDFIERLNALGVAEDGYEFRLPTEAEWEYACRAGTDTNYWWGNSHDRTMANCDADTNPIYAPNVPKTLMTTPVKSYPPNPWGIYDMHGNVAEWCSDWYDYLSRRRAIDPTGGDGYERVFRGGSFDSLDFEIASAWRECAEPHDKTKYNGFRFVLAPKVEGK